MQLSSVTVFAVLCELLALSAFNQGPMMQVTAEKSGFASIDCGGADKNSTDPETTLFWISDSTGFGLEKVSRTGTVPSLPAKYPTWTWLSSMRIFEGTQSKYCYVFDESYGIVETNPYLIRTSFWTGNQFPFPNPNKEQISFKLLINANEWDEIVIGLPQKNPLVKEVYVLATRSRISVCVAGNGDPAFISSLELRPIHNNWPSVNQFILGQDNTAPKLLFLYARLDLGSSTGKDIRYPDDEHDRIWTADTTGPSLSTRRIIIPNNEHTPSAVLQTALTQNSSFNYTLDDFPKSYQFYYDIYFAEISDNVTAPQERVFNQYVITASGFVTNSENINIDPFSGPHHTLEYYSNTLIPVDEGGFFTFYFQRNSTSLYGPLVSALELRYSSKDSMSLGTDEGDVLTLELIKKSLQGFESWRGDPCLPFSYEWLTCDLQISPHITKLSLQNKNITAKIPVEIGNLQALVEIDLRDNNLSGTIPDSIAQLPNLKTLLLQDNNLSGPIPQALLKKELYFSVAGNPILCKDNNAIYCDEQPLQTESNVSSKKVVMPLVAIIVSISAVLVLLVLAFIFIFYFRRKGKTDHAIAITHAEVIKYSNLAQNFNFQQIERITNGFNTKLGFGSFGDVFFGTLSTGLNVAVKVSSRRDGAQEVPEFLNEVALLSRVHHKNLVQLVGYCLHPRLVLVYEYMAKGSLADQLHGTSPSTEVAGNVKVPLSWTDRLKIVLGAAQGLEYLHKGCKPPIIHRDVKCSNILLDEGSEGRISDFGISRSKLAHTDMTVTNVRGTVGYIAPEYVELRITEKIDVYAFGVVLLEVVSGRRPLEGSQHIGYWVRSLLNQSQIHKIVDPRIGADYNMSSMWKVLEVGMACVEQDVERRPDMHEVYAELNSALLFELQNETVARIYDSADLPFDSVNVLAR